jgi:two-component system sensor histidine kinase/response regulator
MIARPSTGTYSDTFAYEPTTVRERASAGGVAVGLLVAPLLLAPFARLQSEPVPTFVATVETVVVTAAVFTASMLYAQFRMQRYAPLAILSVAYALLGLMHAVYLLTFPGAFAPNGLLGAGPQTAAWLGAAARIGFALVVMAYVYVESRPRSQRWKTGMTARICTAAGAYLVACVLLGTLGQASLPSFIASNERIGIAGDCALGVVFLACTGAALALAVYCGPSRRVHLWLTVVMLAMAVEVLAAGFLGGARFTLGWYLAEVDLTIGATLFFIVMQSLLGSILRRAARNGARAVALAEIVALGSDSERTDRNDSMLERGTRYRGLDHAREQHG